MIKEIMFCSREKAEALGGRDDTVIVSICDPNSEPARLKYGFRAVLRVRFDELPEGVSSLHGLSLFSVQQADEIATFIEAVHRFSAPLSLVCHCEAGISRSAAVALFAEALTGASFPERPRAYSANHHVLTVFRAVRPRVGVSVPVRPDDGTLEHIVSLLRFEP